MKKTIVLGASPNEDRYSYKAVSLLLQNEIETFPVGIRNGSIKGLDIIKGKPELKDIHTVSLYVGAERQPEYYNYILSLKPERVIFNPGTENDEFIEILEKNKIEAIEACTLVMLSTSQF